MNIVQAPVRASQPSSTHEFYAFFCFSGAFFKRGQNQYLQILSLSLSFYTDFF